MRVRQDKYGRKGNIGMACLATKEQAKLAIKMLNKTKQYVANEYTYKKQTNNLNNNTKENNKRYKKPVEGKQHQETKTCYVCGSKEHLIKSCKKNTNLFFTNEEWPDISEEELKYYWEKYGKVNSIKTRRNRYLGRDEALVCYRIAEEAKTAFAVINMYQRWTAELYRSTSKDEQNRVNEGYREEQNKAIERRQQKERENTNTSEDKISSSTKEEIENFKKKDLKYIKETLKTITSQQWLANKEEANDNTKEIKKQEKKELKDNNNTQSNKQKETEIEEKGQLPITRNENRKRKDINENIENTKKQDK